MQIDAKQLKAAIRLCGKVADAKSYAPVWRSVRVDEDGAGEGLSLEAGDGVSRLAVTVTGHGNSVRPGMYQAATLAKVAGSAKGQVEVETAESGALRLGVGTLQTSGQVADWPRPPLAVAVAPWGQAGELSAALAWVLPASSTDQTRPHLNSLSLDGQRGRACTTDGHRLHVAAMPASTPTALLPRRAALALAAMLAAAPKGETAQVGVAVDGDKGQWFACQAGGARLTVRCLDATFPDVDQVIPHEDPTYRTTVDSAVLRAALKAISPYCSDRAWGVRLAMSPGQPLVLAVDNPNMGEARQSVTCLCRAEEGRAEEGLVTAFNMRFLSEALTGAEDVGELAFGADALAPVVVRRPGRLAVIMPMRI